MNRNNADTLATIAILLAGIIIALLIAGCASWQTVARQQAPEPAARLLAQTCNDLPDCRATVDLCTDIDEIEVPVCRVVFEKRRYE